MRVLVACEFSGVVRDAFLARGHDAYSADLYPSKNRDRHIQGDVLRILGDGWDLMIAHPPCTHLTCAGSRFFKRVDKKLKQLEALEFFRTLLEAPIPQICVENPVGIASTRIRKPDQIIQPYWFGDPQRKTTCLWLKGLSPLVPTMVVKPLIKRYANSRSVPTWNITRRSYNDLRLKQERSVTFPGIAKAMAEQWG